LTEYTTSSGWVDAFPFFVVIVVLALRGKSLPGRGEPTEQFPSVGTGRINVAGLVAVAAATCLVLLLAPVAWVSGVTVTISFGIILLSVVVVTGYTGQLSLCQFALAGVGAYVAGRLIAVFHIPLELALLAAVVLAIPVGFVVALPALGSRGANLAMATLCLAVALESVLFDSASLTGNGNGTNIGSPSFLGISMNSVSDPRGYGLVAAGFAVVVGILVVNLRRSRTGRQLLAVRVNERAASAIGVNVFGAKMRAFVIGSVLAAVGGVLWAFMNSSVVYSSFGWLSSVTVTGLGVIGGLGYAAGPYFGASLQPGSIGTNIGNLLGSGVQRYLLLAGGVSMILVLLQSPDGIAPKMGRDLSRGRELLFGRLLKRPGRPVGTKEIEIRRTIERTRVDQAGPSVRRFAVREPSELVVEDVTVRFGGVTAVDSVSLGVRAGEVLGIIGPNGAGKTTLIEVIMGFVRPTRGRVMLGGDDVSRLSPRQRAALGLGMTFQSLELFEDMTVFENLLVAAEVGGRRAVIQDVIYPGRPRVTDSMVQAIEVLGLQGDLDQPVKELPYGRRRLVAVARAVTADPSVLLLDEPVAGLSSHESVELRSIVRNLADMGTAVALIEHDVEFVMATCDRIAVLNFGRVIAEGSPSVVRSDAAVIDAYLGTAAASLSERAASGIKP
jgi:ABC-type branched-subunit amino acid transport system ATPase component/ABC-type branched-subunit amino acid transport system permease subunit